MQIAQATGAPNSGASNSEDFQPPTGSPQAAPANLFQQQGGLQNTDSESILNDSNAIITVPSGNGSRTGQVKSAATTNELSLTPFFIALAIAIAVVVIVVALSRKKSDPNELTEQIVSKPEQAETTQEVGADENINKLAKPKKSKKTARRSRKKKKK